MFYAAQASLSCILVFAMVLAVVLLVVLVAVLVVTLVVVLVVLLVFFVEYTLQSRPISQVCMQTNEASPHPRSRNLCSRPGLSADARNYAARSDHAQIRA